MHMDIQRVMGRLKMLHWKSWWVRGGAGALVVAVIFGAFFIGHKDPSASQSSALRAVALLSLAAYGSGSASAPTATLDEVVARAEVGGKVVSVSNAGTRVRAGATIAQLENSAQRASLLQAEGALEAAEAGQQKTQNGLRSEQVSIREASYESAKSSAISALISAYSSVESSIHSTSDQMFTPVSGQGYPTFLVRLKNSSYKYELEQKRLDMEAVLNRQNDMVGKVNSSSDLYAELTTTEGELRAAIDFMQLLATALSGAISSETVSSTQIATYVSSVSASRTALTTALSNVTSAEGALVSAQKSVQEGVSYTQDTDLQSASASVKQARGAYDAALSAYQKTLIKANVNGTVSSCSVGVGDVISTGADVCRIQPIGGSLSGSFLLPLSAVKYTPEGASVFTLGEGNTVVEVSVQTGLVTASSVSVTGLFGDEKIIADVRGLKAGDVVSVQQ